MRIAIIFFGLTRTLEKTIDSLKTNLFAPLEEACVSYDVFIHTYKINGPYRNAWSGENVDNYHNEDVEILNPKYLLFDDQETIEKSIDFSEYYKKLGSWSKQLSPELTRYLIKNMCLALYSKKQITMLFDEHIDDYDYAMIIRPDTKLHNKIDVSYFNELNESNIIIPEKDQWSGCNDRICLGKPNVVSYYGKLFDDLKEYSENKSIISEVYLLDKLNEKSINIIQKNIDYNNIRV